MQACCNYCVKGVIPFEALHDQILRRVFDENGDRRYCMRITAAEDRSLVYEKTRYNGRPVNPISVDSEGRIIETDGPELLAFLQKNGVRTAASVPS